MKSCYLNGYSLALLVCQTRWHHDCFWQESCSSNTNYNGSFLGFFVVVIVILKDEILKWIFFFKKVLQFNSRFSIEILNFKNGGGSWHSMVTWEIILSFHDVSPRNQYQ